ncbi:MAG: sulfatase [Phycisphaerae bacterium]|nr:sulfatase [Phycisphaerae bacterium]
MIRWTQFRLWWGGLFVIGILLIAVFSPAGCRKPPEVGRLPEDAEGPPNIVFLLVDALRADRLGAYGSGRGLSPVMDKFAAEGITFDRPIAQAPWTQPSVASLFSAYYPGVHKVLNYKLAFRSTHEGQPKVAVFRDEFTTLAEVLQRHGYQTAAFSANPFIVPAYGFGQGFDHFDAGFAKNTTPGSVVNEAALKWLAGRDTSQPFFIYLHYMDVHGPYEGDLEYLEAQLPRIEQIPNKYVLSEKENKRLGYLRRVPKGARDPARHQRLMGYREYWEARYEAGVRAMDIHLAALREQLSEMGLWEDAYVILTADHGEALCEHGIWEHGFSVHHNQLHVPLILRWAGVLPAGKRVRTPARLIDFMPTLLDQFRLPPVAGVQGRSLVPYLQEQPPTEVPIAFAECVKLGTEQKALYLGDLKLLYVASDPPRRSLFNIAVDPSEQNDLAGSSGFPLSRMLELLRRRLDDNAALAPQSVTHVTLSDEERRRLESLGYLDGADTSDAPRPTTTGAPEDGGS